jgi:hypothetical protein
MADPVFLWSPNRHVGVYAMFDLMKQKALQAEKKTAAA